MVSGGRNDDRPKQEWCFIQEGWERPRDIQYDTVTVIILLEAECTSVNDQCEQ